MGFMEEGRSNSFGTTISRPSGRRVHEGAASGLRASPGDGFGGGRQASTFSLHQALAGETGLPSESN
jgi:hypothetical protein